MFRESTFRSTEQVLNVARGPAAGPPLVLLHGVTRRWQDFSPLLAPLAARWEIFALDFRGHGKSQRAKGYRTIDYLHDAAALLRDIVPEPAVVYGHSLGAMVAAAVAAELPERVRAVVLEDPPWDTLGARIRETSFHRFFAGMQRVASEGGTVDELAHALAQIEVRSSDGTSLKLGDVRDAASLRFGAACLKQIDPAVLQPITAGRWLEGYDREALLACIRCPTLLLQADFSAGGMLPDADADRAQRRITNCLRVRLDGVGHLMHWLARERVLSLVIGFVESLDD